MSENYHHAEIFHPYAFKRFQNAEKIDQKFVHYTSAQAAMEILTSRQIWLRKASCMNDFMEIEHGLECLVNFYRHSTVGAKFKKVLEKKFPGVCQKIEDRFNPWIPHLKSDTYMLCVSEHDQHENNLGRLSMWRAYGRDRGVAFVMNNAPFLSESDALKAYTSPVAYLDKMDFEKECELLVEGISNNLEYLDELGEENTIRSIFDVFKFAILCTKHPGFAEEREWRVVYSPTLSSSVHVVKEVEVIDGLPQPVCKIPLKNIPEENFKGAEIPDLLDRIIIGPTEYPNAICEAFESVLSDCGVSKPRDKISVSNIPIR